MLSRGVYPVSFSTFDAMRVWAALTGVALAVLYFVMAYVGAAPSETLPMLITAIGGFELFLFTQDKWLKRRDGHG